MPVAKDPVEILQAKKLLHCVRVEDYAQIEKLVEKGVRQLVNYNEPFEGETALILASSMNNEKMIEFLVQHGAHPNIVDFKGRSPLMRAAELGHVQALELLTKFKADPLLKDKEGKDILFYCLAAPTNRHGKCLEIVMTIGANVNSRTLEGLPIIVEACKEAKERKDLCLTLIENGADPTIPDDKTMSTALHFAASSGSVEVCRAILKKGGNPNAADKNKVTPAHEAAVKGHFEILVLLSAYGAHFDAYDIKGNNPVHYAAFGNAGSCCRFLATRGCNPKAKNNDGELPKNIAKSQKAKDAMKNLRKAESQYGKLSKQTTESGGVNWSIRLYDYMNEHRDRVKDLFKIHDQEETGKVTNDAFTEVVSNEGFQSLVETDEMQKLIMSHEKSKDQIDYELFLNGKKYINKQFLIASFEKKKKKKKKGKGKKGKTKIIMPVCTLDEGPRMEGGDPPAIYQPQHIHFTDTNRFNRDKPPEHPLQDDSAWYIQYPEKEFVGVTNAVFHGDLHTVLDAFKRGLPVDIRDKYFKTPLMVAAANGDLKAVKFLLQCGCDVNAYDNFKWTALHHACHSGQLDLVKLLVEKGANVNAVSITQGTPLMRAVESASLPVVEFLLEQNVKLSHENIQGNTVLDVAREFADPRVYQVIKAKFASLPKLKDNKKKAKPKKKKENKKNKDDEPIVYKDNFLPPINLRPTSHTRAEEFLAQNMSVKEHLLFRPVHSWTEQDTTEDLMIKKQQFRDRFGWEFDFEDFKIPLVKNAINRLNKDSIET